MNVNVQELLDQLHVIRNNSIGKGKKKCPACSNIVAARISKCNCGHVFYEAKSVVKKARYTPPPVANMLEEFSSEIKQYKHAIGGDFGRIIYTPVGQCKAKLKSDSEKDVFKFADDVVDEGIENGVVYTVEAIKYFARHTHDVNSVEYKNISKHLESWYRGLVSYDEFTQ